MDYYKDSAKKNMSVVAFIASLNGTQENKLNCTKYFSRCHLQPITDEFCSGLTVFMLGNFITKKIYSINKILIFILRCFEQVF